MLTQGEAPRPKPRTKSRHGRGSRLRLGAGVARPPSATGTRTPVQESEVVIENTATTHRAGRPLEDGPGTARLERWASQQIEYCDGNPVVDRAKGDCQGTYL